MRVFLTGGRGYVGSGLARALAQRGWEVLQPDASWRMPAEPPPHVMTGTDAVVHAAWDMRPSSPDRAFEVNVEGSARILEATRTAGISRAVLISSMSAYPGCVSLYGRMKREVELSWLDRGASAVRPGLVYGANPGGMVGKLRGLVAKLPVIPLPCASAFQYLVHEDDLGEYICRLVEGSTRPGLHTVAHPTPTTMADIIRSLASDQNLRRRILPIPWQPVWLALFLAAKLRLPTPVTEDNLLGLARPNPIPDFTPLANSGFMPRPLRSSHQDAKI